MVSFFRLSSKQFLALLCMSLSLVLLASGAVTWVAVNWESISPTVKLVTVQAVLLLIGAVLLLLRLRFGAEQLVAAAGMQWLYQGLAFLGAVVSGALIALVGQIYQTGADTWQTFGLWFLLILPWLAFAPGIFIAALAAVVANTAAFLFLYHNQFGVPFELSAYVLAFLNAAVFVYLEEKRSQQEPLWGVLSMSLLICAIVIFAMARAAEFAGVTGLYLLIAAVLLLIYNKLRFSLLRLNVLALAVAACAFSAVVLERTVFGDVFDADIVSVLYMLVAIWIMAAVAAIALWQQTIITKKGASRRRALGGDLPLAFTVFLAISSFLVAAFIYLILLFTGLPVKMTMSPQADIVALLALGGAYAMLYRISNKRHQQFFALVLYQIACFIAFVNNHEFFIRDSVARPLSVQLLTVVGLVISVLIYRRRSEAVLRFISSLGFFVFFGGLRFLPFLSFANEPYFLVICFIGLIYFSFKSSSELRLPLITAFALWVISVVLSNYYFYFISYHGQDQLIDFKNILLAFLHPLRLFWFTEGFPGAQLVFASLLYWSLAMLASLTPLWVLWQLLKNDSPRAKAVTVLTGLLVAWLWFGRLDVVAPLAFIVLAYYKRSVALYCLALVLALIALAGFYFSLLMPLEHKAYLLLLSGALFLLPTVFSARWLSLGDEVGGREPEVLASSAEATPVEAALFTRRRFYGLLAVAILCPIALCQWQVMNYEAVTERGRYVLLRLAPLDPRSLMQGDYMRLNYEVTGIVDAALKALHKNEYQATANTQLSERLLAPLQEIKSVRILAEFELIDGVAERLIAFYAPSELKDLPKTEDRVYLPFIRKRPYRIDSGTEPAFSTEYFFHESRASDFAAARFAEVAANNGRVMLKNLLDMDRRVIRPRP